MPARIDLAELRAARKMAEPKVLVLGDEEFELPGDIEIEVATAIFDGEFKHAFELILGPDYRDVIKRFHLTARDCADIVKEAYLGDDVQQRLGELLASATSSNGTGARSTPT